MDKELKEIENSLNELKPSNLEREFCKKINGIFDLKTEIKDSKTKNKKIIHLVFTQKSVTAAAILIAFIGVFFAFLNDSNRNNLKSISTNNEGDKNLFVPIKAKNTFEGVSEDEIFLSEDKRPYQPVRYKFSDSFIWKNKADGSLIEMNIPSQRLFYVPIKTD